MKTVVLKINAKKPQKSKIKRAACFLTNNETVVFPTETVYGLGANALDEKAVKKIFKAKGRPSDNPIIVHVASIDETFFLAKVNETALKLMKHFWPGPLTLVMKSSGLVPKVVTGGLDTIALRLPNHPVALALIKECSFPIAAPSANISGRPSATTAKHVLDDLRGRVDCIIDSGAVKIGLESTVLDVSAITPVLLRPGNITVEKIEKIIGKIKIHKSSYGSKLSGSEFAKAPGMKYTHYAPRAKVILIEADAKNKNAKIKKLKEELRGKKVVFIKSKNKPKLASDLFKMFREFDKSGANFIVVEGVNQTGLGLAIMNRVRKAASKVIL